MPQKLGEMSGNFMMPEERSPWSANVAVAEDVPLPPLSERRYCFIRRHAVCVSAEPLISCTPHYPRQRR